MSDSIDDTETRPTLEAKEELTPMDILAAAFFLGAGLWLVIAILYTMAVYLFIRMRRRGELQNPFDPAFGRVYICNTCIYIPMGPIFRRFMRHLTRELEESAVRVMTREERRRAVQTLLQNAQRSHRDLGIATQDVEAPEGDSSCAPTCSICLGEYEPDDVVLAPTTCPHIFHKECILDWLERPGNTACPCCRVIITDEEGVWDVVRSQRRGRWRARRKHWPHAGQGSTPLEPTERTSSVDEAEDAGNVEALVPVEEQGPLSDEQHLEI